MILLLIAAAAAQPGMAARPLRDFGDWTAGCDNGRLCQVVALMPDDAGDEDPPYATLQIERAAGGDAKPRVTLGVAWDERQSGTVLVVDHKPTRFRFTANGDLADDADAMALVRTMAAAHALTFVDAGGKTVGRVSPHGASAALRWMDEQQRRAGTTTALVATGARRFRAPAPALPRIVPAGRSAKRPRPLSALQLAAVRKQADCGDNVDRAPEKHRLDAAHSLVFVPCLIGAYQASSLVLLVDDRGRWRPASIEQRFASERAEETPLERAHFTEPEFDAAGQMLWTAYKGRGLGDCGATEAYVWDGRSFRLAYLSMMERCAGSTARITLWRTKNHPEP